MRTATSKIKSNKVARTRKRSADRSAHHTRLTTIGKASIVYTVADQKGAAPAQPMSEQRFRALVERSSDAIALASSDGTILYASPGAARIVGTTPERMVGRNTFDGVHPDDLERSRTIFNQVLENAGSSVSSQFRLRHRDGSWRWVEGSGTNLLHEPSVQAMVANYRDITDHKLAEEEIRQRVSHQAALNAVIAAATEASTDLNVLMETALDVTLRGFGLEMGAIWLTATPEADSTTVLQGVTTETIQALSQAAELAIVNMTQPSVTEDWSAVTNRFGSVVRDHGIRASIIVPLLAAGQRIGGLGIVSPQPRRWSEEEIALAGAIGQQLGMTVERARLFGETRTRAGQLELLYDAGLALNQTLDVPSLMESLLQIMNKVVRADQTDFFRFDPESQTLVLELVAGYREGIDLSGLRSRRFAIGNEHGLVGRIAADREPLFLSDVRSDPRWISVDPSIRSALWVPVEQQGKLRGVFTVKSKHLNAFTVSDQRLIMLFTNQLSVALENARLFDETRRRLLELEVINRISIALRVAQDLGEMLPILVRETASLLRASVVTIELYNPATDELIQVAEHGSPPLAFSSKSRDGIDRHVFATGQRYVAQEFKSDPLTDESDRQQLPTGLGGMCVPIRASDQVIGVCFVAVSAPRQLTPDETAVLTTIAEIAGNAIHRARLYEQTEQHMRHLDALHQIDKTITSSLDIRLTLNVIVDQVITRLQVDAASILLINPLSQTLEYRAGRGFRTHAIASTRLNLGEAHAGRIVLERRAIYLPENISAGTSVTFRKFLESEQFVSYYGVPLIVKGKVKGVLEVFHRRPLITTTEWVNFIDALAEQTAIAVDNALLFSELERSNTELVLAYDTTLEGWSRALDLRDKETEGHTQRVTDMALRLAHGMGIADAEMIHIRRGALLHDIGKMGIPDQILFKSGPLTEAEWDIMHKHPIYAYELLSPIMYLRPAIDISYCHHEKWDGTGYPRGLRGEQIPLSARIFAVVDVWDALRSDRPYRPAWSEDKVREYIRSQAGIHFDSHIVTAFLEMVEQDTTLK